MKRYIFSITVAIIALFIGANVASAINGNSKTIFSLMDRENTWYVDDDSECPGNGTLESPYCKIQYAINKANEFDIIKVANGTYYENIIINKKGIDLEWNENDIIGQDVGKPIIDGGDISDVVKIFANNINISQFTIQNSSDLNFGVNILAGEINLLNCNIIDNYNGIQLLENQSSLCTIDSCTIRDNTITGIFLFDMSSDNKIINCQIINNTWGVWVCESPKNKIHENLFSENDIGVVLQGANTYNNNLVRCVFKKNKIGLWLYGSANKNSIHYCDFIDNTNKYGPLSFLTGFTGKKGAWRMHALFTMCSYQNWQRNYWSPRPLFQNTTQPYPIWGTVYPNWIARFLPEAWRPQIPWVNIDMNPRAEPLGS